MSPVRFVADAMLKKLARWLRIFGAETDFLDRPDNDILAFLKKHPSRILLTQDVQLHERAGLRRLRSFLVPRDTTTEEQVAAVLRHFQLSLDDFPARTICPSCNGRLAVVGKKEAEGKVLPEVLARHEQFWLCEKCGKAYWEGTHWKRISEAAEKISRMLAEAKR